jgi:hypothetical protein
MIIEINVPKAGMSVSFDTEDPESVPEAMYVEAVRRGLEDMVNMGLTALTRPKLGGGLEAAAKEKVEANVAAIKAGTLRTKGQKAASGKVSGAVMTEARRIAKNLIKDEIKRKGKKISHYDPSDITLAANELLKEQPDIIKQAEANLAERNKVEKLGIDVTALIHESPKKVAAAAKKSAERKKPTTSEEGIPPAHVAAKSAQTLTLPQKGKPNRPQAR